MKAMSGSPGGLNAKANGLSCDPDALSFDPEALSFNTGTLSFDPEALSFDVLALKIKSNRLIFNHLRLNCQKWSKIARLTARLTGVRAMVELYKIWKERLAGIK